jgi:ammonia channel protein AmtB
LVYNFIACWTWSPVGWLRKFGALDFAGGYKNKKKTCLVLN